MFFVEDYTKTKAELKEAGDKLEENVKNIFLLHGAAIGNYPEESKTVLENQGFNIKSREDMVNAVSDLFVEGGEKWEKFSKQFMPLLQTTAKRIQVEKKEESGWVQAVIGAVGALGSGISGAVASKNQRQAAKDTAKAEMNKGLTSIILEKEKRKTQQKMWMNILIGVVILAIATVVVVLIIKNKKKQQA